MKCTDCQGTGLENDNKLCQNCGGLGEIKGEEREIETIIPTPEPKPKKAKVEKPVVKKAKK